MLGQQNAVGIQPEVQIAVKWEVCTVHMYSAKYIFSNNKQCGVGMTMHGCIVSAKYEVQCVIYPLIFFV